MKIQFTTVTWYSRLIAAILFILILPAWMFYVGREYQKTIDVLQDASHTHTFIQDISSNTPYMSPFDATYTIDNAPVTLVKGLSERSSAPGSASKVVTQAFGNPTYGDLDGDGFPDAVFFLTQDSGGSGTFYYVAVALNKGTSYQGLQAVYLGDRIAPQTISISNGMVSVNYADRKKGEPMSTSPSVGITKYLSVKNGSIVEITK